MKNKSRAWSQIVIIFVVWMVVSYISREFELGALIEGMDTLEIETVFDTLSSILAVLALILGVGYLVYRSARGEVEAIWREWDEGEE